MNRITQLVIAAYDALQAFSESEKTRRFVASFLVLYFLCSLSLIELNRFGLLPEWLAGRIAMNRFAAVNQAFTLVLILEVVELVFSLPKSTSKSVGKQFEILALILLRAAFKSLSQFPEPIYVDQHQEVLYELGLNALGALAVFLLLGAYAWLSKTGPWLKPPRDLARFIVAKKLVAMGVLTSFLFLAGENLIHHLCGLEPIDVFHDFFTLLIFADVLLLLIAQRHIPEFHTIFRNSGFALSTMLIRLALTAGTTLSVVVSVCAMLFAVGVKGAFNLFYGRISDSCEIPPAPPKETPKSQTVVVHCDDKVCGHQDAFIEGKPYE